jgi:hypothetical protein
MVENNKFSEIKDYNVKDFLDGKRGLSDEMFASKDNKKEKIKKDRLIQVKNYLDIMSNRHGEEKYSDSIILQNLNTIKNCLESKLIHEDRINGLFNGEVPIHSEKFNYWPFGGKEYYLHEDPNGSIYKMQTNIFSEIKKGFDYKDFI